MTFEQVLKDATQQFIAQHMVSAAVPGMTFEQYVYLREELVIAQEAAKLAVKRLGEIEMTMRKAIAASAATTMPDGLKEGVNTFALTDGRKLKITRKITRTIEEAQMASVREEFERLNSQSVTFDSLLRTKYELSVAAFRQLDETGAHVVSRMITAKDGTVEMVLD